MNAEDNKAKKRKKSEKESDLNIYDNSEIEFKMMEQQLYSWLISSAYPQVDSHAGGNRKTKTEKSKKKT